MRAGKDRDTPDLVGRRTASLNVNGVKRKPGRQVLVEQRGMYRGGTKNPHQASGL